MPCAPLCVSISISCRACARTAALSTLCANDVTTDVQALLDVLWRTNHVHDWDTSRVQLVDHFLWGDADSRHEQSGLRLNDDVNQLGQVALGVVFVGLACSSADFGEQQVNAKRCILVVEASFELLDIGTEHLGRVAYTTDDPDTTVVCNGGSELGACSNVHACEEDRVLDSKLLCDWRGDRCHGVRDVLRESPPH